MTHAAPTRFLLRIFSGPQVGATIALPAGTFVIGSDDSCDIILSESGLAARHAELTIPPDQENPPPAGEAPDFVPPTFTPLDGDVLSNGTPLPPGPLPGPGVPLFWGTVCMGMALPGQEKSAWNTLRETLNATAPIPHETGPQSASETEHTATDPEAEPAPQTSGEKTPPLEAADANIVGITLPETPARLPLIPRRRTTRFALFGLVAAALLALTVQYMPGAGPEARVAALRRALAEAGHGNIDIILKKHSVTLRGVLQNDAERAEVLSLARRVQFPVHLDIRIRQDKKSAIEAAFAGRGFHLRVTDDPASEGALSIAGYMQDRLVEEWGFSSARDDVPGLTDEESGTIQRRIRHADEVAAVLEPALVDAGLAFVTVGYLPGVVELTADLDGEQKERLGGILQVVQADLGVPLSTRLLSPTQVVRATRPARNLKDTAPTPAGATTEKKAESTDREAFRIVEVILSPLPFVRLATGERVFEGGVLPGGMTLKQVGLHELVLSREGRESIYKLRGV